MKSLKSIILSGIVIATSFSAHSDQLKSPQVTTAMKKVTEYMVDKVSYQGGFVWSYLPDFSRQWGELEARRSMIWLQPPGTATVGHVLLDAYHATGDEYYYRAAQKVVSAIIFAQHPSGGWNYVADFEGEQSLKSWYNTIGKNAWRLEEFHHYFGNATFDDGGTAEASTLLLRMYLEKRDPQYKAPLNKAIEFVVNSQYPIGGWPQRFPLATANLPKGNSQYPSYITFNDDVAAANIDFLLLCLQTLGEQRLRDPLIRAMNSFLVTQQGPEQPGWALQYTTELEPAGARSYEPKSISTRTTADNILMLIKFYRLTGDSKFIARVPEAISWLESLRVAESLLIEGRTHPSFIEIGTGKPLYTHRRGTNVFSGEYYTDNNPSNMLAHYKSAATIHVDELKRAYEEVAATTKDEINKHSPLKSSVKVEIPEYFSLGKISLSDLNVKEQQRLQPASESLAMDAARLVADIEARGFWLTQLHYTSHPYIGEPPKSKTRVGGKAFSNTLVGDRWDTSPYPSDKPVMGISTGVYVKNMASLIRYLNSLEPNKKP